MGNVPSGNNENLRAKLTDEIWANGIQVSVMVRDGNLLVLPGQDLRGSLAKANDCRVSTFIAFFERFG